MRLEVTEESLDMLAERVAALVLERVPKQESPSPYMTTAEAAGFLRCKPQRIHDLLSAGRLTRFKDGSRTLVLRAELEAHVESGR